MNPHTKRTHTSSFSTKGAGARYGVGVKKYEILEHRADLKIRVFGKDKKELFSNALFGMSESIKAEVKKPEEKIKRRIKIKSADLLILLVDFLSGALYLSQVNKEIYFDIIFKKLTNQELKGELIGQKVSRFNEDIKAVTYHQLEVKQNKDGSWQATILFDI